MGLECTDETGKIKQHDNPFIEPVQNQTVVDMKGHIIYFHSLHFFLIIKYVIQIADVMVLNDIIEQAAGRHSRASDRGGKMITSKI